MKAWPMLLAVANAAAAGWCLARGDPAVAGFNAAVCAWMMRIALRQAQELKRQVEAREAKAVDQLLRRRRDAYDASRN